MDTRIFRNNLALLARHPLSHLGIAEDGETLIVADRKADEAAKAALLKVVQATQNFEKSQKRIWVKIAEKEGVLLGMPAEKLLSRANKDRPVEDDECEKHSKVTFLVGGEKIEADRDLLLQHKGLFAMFASDFKEKEKQEILLPEINPVHFREFISLLEGEELSSEDPSKDPNDWIVRLQLADRLGGEAEDFVTYAATRLLSLISLDQLGEILETNEEIFRPLVRHVNPKEAAHLARVITRWIDLAEPDEGTIPETTQQLIHTAKMALVDFINHHKIPIKEITGTKRVSGIIDWLAGTRLEYANFSRLPLTNQDLAKLLQTFPFIKYLSLSSCSQIEGDALKHLNFVPELESLDISGTNLENAALKHLQWTPKLQVLYMNGCNLDKGAIPESLNVTIQEFFGPEAYQRAWYYVKVLGELEVIPERLKAKKDAKDPFFNKPLDQSFPLVYFPKKVLVHGVETVLTLNNLELITGKRFDISEDLRKQFGNVPLQSGWRRISLNIIPDSEDISYDEQKQMVESKRHRLPRVLEVAVFIYLVEALTGKKLYSTRTSCFEQLVGKDPHVMICLTPEGRLTIEKIKDYSNYGAGAVPS